MVAVPRAFLSFAEPSVLLAVITGWVVLMGRLALVYWPAEDNLHYPSECPG